MATIDPRRKLRPLYDATVGRCSVVQVPRLRYLMIDGAGDPNTGDAFPAAIEALYSVSYAAKFVVKRGPIGVDYRVMPLEGLWWADDMRAFTDGDKSQWQWTLMILQPEAATPQIIEQARADVAARKSLAALPLLRAEAFTEGQCAQTLHIGPFATEGPTVAALHDFIAARGHLVGKHHEIYLSDMRRAAPEKWKTIIRQPWV